MKETHILLIGMILVILALVSYRATYALFSDTASSTSNSFAAASQFPVSPPQESPTPTPTPTPNPETSIKINEFLAGPTANNPEWVELVNTGASAVDLTGWTIRDSNISTSDDLTLSGTINPGEFIAFDNDEPGGWLNNGGDTATLRNASAGEIDVHTYGVIAVNTTIGRSPDGTGAFKTCGIITKNASNVGC